MHELRQTGFCDLSLELTDHNRRGGEQIIIRGAGRACLILFHLSVPAFEL